MEFNTEHDRKEAARLKKRWDLEHAALVEASEAFITGAEAMGYPAGEWVAEYYASIRDSGYDRYYVCNLIINHVYEMIQKQYMERADR